MGVLVHRIDKDTSGLLVVAKNDEAQLNLAKQFFIHSIERRYVAIVWGNLKDDQGTITGNIGRDPNDRMRFKVFPDGDHGKHAVTHYRVLERFGYVTVVECRLETGRTHQIRVHMEYAKHPLVGDPVYTSNGPKTASAQLGLERQFLHSYKLGLDHPITQEHLEFADNLPADLQEALDSLAGRSRGRTEAGEQVFALLAESPVPCVQGTVNFS